VTHNGIALAPGSLDAVLMSMVYHDTYWYDPKVDWGPVDRQALLESLYAALAPGGVVGVVDHDAARAPTHTNPRTRLIGSDAAVVAPATSPRPASSSKRRATRCATRPTTARSPCSTTRCTAAPIAS